MRFMPSVCIDVATNSRSNMDVCLGVGGRDKQVILSRSEQEQDCVMRVIQLLPSKRMSPYFIFKVPSTDISLSISNRSVTVVLRNMRTTRIQNPDPRLGGRAQPR